jgi:SAM-dependent methyltransferase
MASALAFDRAAADYDQVFGRNPIGRLFRYVFQERLLRLFPAGARLLDLGCGTGEDALFLSSRGYRVTGIDVAPGMVERAREKAAQQQRAEARFVVGSFEDLEALGRDWDGAYSNFGALNCADLRAAGRGLALALRPGAPLLLSVMGPRLERAGVAPRVGGIPLPVAYPTPGRLRRAFGPEFSWRSGFALGVLLPGPQHAGWAARNPQAFGLLAIAESLVRGWPVLRGLGDHNVIEGARR